MRRCYGYVFGGRVDPHNLRAKPCKRLLCAVEDDEEERRRFRGVDTPERKHVTVRKKSTSHPNIEATVLYRAVLYAIDGGMVVAQPEANQRNQQAKAKKKASAREVAHHLESWDVLHPDLQTCMIRPIRYSWQRRAAPIFVVGFRVVTGFLFGLGVSHRVGQIMILLRLPTPSGAGLPAWL